MRLPLVPFSFGLFLASLFTANASAAKISYIDGDDGFDLITIEGEIEAGDDIKFKEYAIKSSSALVVLQSAGGSLMPALEIGKTIQIKGFSTYVPSEAFCTSSCALIWVAGQSRLLSRNAGIGFHASYRDNDGKLEEVGVANAVVGRYLTLLNLPEKSVIFATTASPDEILWIDPQGRKTHGMPFELFDFDDTSGEVATPPNPPPIRTYRAGPAQATPDSYHEDIEWYYAGRSKTGSILYALAEDVLKGREDSSSATIWIMTDDSNNRTVSSRSTKTFYEINCLSRTYKLITGVDIDPQGRSKSFDGSMKNEYIVPGSVFESVEELVCTDQLPSPDRRDLKK